jgi:hypothetical protein
MELKRMKSSEHKPKVCTKLFPRHNSADSCISPTKNDTNLASGMLENVASTSEVISNSTTDSPVALPVVSKENLVNKSCKFVTPIRTVRINVPLELKITPFKLQECNTPKFVKLTNFDMKKLVPISKEDIKIKLATVNSSDKVQNSSPKPNVAIMTQIPIKKISPGDIFKAIKVGNTFQLVPIEHKSDSNKKN